MPDPWMNSPQNPSSMFYQGPIAQPITPAAQTQAPLGFQLDPMQAQTDIAMGGLWGGPLAAPQMNPFSMFGGMGDQQGFNWPGFFGGFK